MKFRRFYDNNLIQVDNLLFDERKLNKGSTANRGIVLKLRSQGCIIQIVRICLNLKVAAVGELISVQNLTSLTILRVC